MEYGLGEQFGDLGRDPMTGVGSKVVPLCVLFRNLFFDGPSADKLIALGGVFQGEIPKKMIASARELCLAIERQTKKGSVFNKQQMIQEEAKGLAAAELEALKGDIELCEDEGGKREIMQQRQKLLKAWSMEEFSEDVLNRAKSKVELKTAGQDTRPDAERKWEVVRSLFYCLLYHSTNIGFSKEVTGRFPEEIDYWAEASKVLNGLSNAALCLQQKSGEEAAPFTARLHRALQTMEWISWTLCPVATPRREGAQCEMEESKNSEEEQTRRLEKQDFVRKIKANVRDALAEKAVAAIPPAKGWIQATVLVNCGHQKELFLQQLVAYYQSQSELVTQHTVRKLDKPISNNPGGRATEEWQLRNEQNTSLVKYTMGDKAQPREEAEGEEPEGKEVEVRKLQQILSQEIQKQHQALRSEIQEFFNQATPSKVQETQRFAVNALQTVPLPPGPPPNLHPCGLHMVGACTAGAACPFNHMLADAARAAKRERSRSPRRRRSRSPEREREDYQSQPGRSGEAHRSDTQTWLGAQSGGRGYYRQDRYQQGFGKGGYESGKGGFRQRAGAGGKGRGKGSDRDLVCHVFQRHGKCWYEDKCRFLHEGHDAGRDHDREKNERGRDAVPRSSQKRR